MGKKGRRGLRREDELLMKEMAAQELRAQEIDPTSQRPASPVHEGPPRFVAGCVDLGVPGSLHEASLRLGGSSRFIFDRSILPPINKYLGVQKKRRKRRGATRMHVAPVDSAATKERAATMRETRKARFHDSVVGRWAQSFSDAYELDGSEPSAAACLGIAARPPSPPTDYRNNPSFARRAAEARLSIATTPRGARAAKKALAATIRTVGSTSPTSWIQDAGSTKRRQRGALSVSTAAPIAPMSIVAPAIEELVSENATFYRRASSEVVMRRLHLRATNTLPTAMRFYLTMDTQIRNMHFMQTLYVVEVMRQALGRASKVTGESIALRIGVVGCGRIGRGIVTKLLNIGCDPRSICIMSRRTEPVALFIARGVQHCPPKHCAAMARCQILFLCCLPLHLSAISNLLRPHLTDKSLICSLVVGCSAGRLKGQFHTSNIIRSLVSAGSLQKRSGIGRGRRGSMRRTGHRAAASQKQMWVGGAAKKASQRHAEKLARIESARRERQQREKKAKHESFHAMRVPREQLVSYISATLVNFEQQKAHTHITCFIAAVMNCMLENFKLLKSREAQELARSIILGPKHAKPVASPKPGIWPQQGLPEQQQNKGWTKVQPRRPSTLGLLREDGSLPSLAGLVSSLTEKVEDQPDTEEVPTTTKEEQLGFTEEFATIAGTFFEQTFKVEEEGS